MTLFQSWADSLTLLKPKNLQLFVMVTIKSIIEAYKLYFKYFWWLLIIFLASSLGPNFQYTITNYTSFSLLLFFFYAFGVSLFYRIPLLAVCLITRPSILQKDCSYFCTQFKKNFLWLCMDFLISIVTILCFMGIMKALPPAHFFQFSILISFLSLLLSFFQWSFNVFCVLFFTDTDGGFKNYFLSLWAALKMSIYNLPLICVINACFFLPIIFFNHVVYISPVMKLIIGAFLMPIGVCTYANIYIKRLHDQFDLYFKQPQ